MLSSLSAVCLSTISCEIRSAAVWHAEVAANHSILLGNASTYFNARWPFETEMLTWLTAASIIKYTLDHILVTAVARLSP